MFVLDGDAAILSRCVDGGPAAVVTGSCVVLAAKLMALDLSFEGFLVSVVGASDIRARESVKCKSRRVWKQSGGLWALSGSGDSRAVTIYELMGLLGLPPGIYPSLEGGVKPLP